MEPRKKSNTGILLLILVGIIILGLTYSKTIDTLVGGVLALIVIAIIARKFPKLAGWIWLGVILLMWTVNAYLLWISIPVFLFCVAAWFWTNIGVKTDTFLTAVPPANYFKLILLQESLIWILTGDLKEKWSGSEQDDWTGVVHQYTGLENIVFEMCGGKIIGFPPRQPAKYPFLWYELKLNDEGNTTSETGKEAGKKNDAQTNMRVITHNDMTTLFPKKFTTSIVVRHMEAKDRFPVFFVVDLIVEIAKPQKYMYFDPIGQGALKRVQKVLEAYIKKYAEKNDAKEIIAEDTTTLGTNGKGFLEIMAQAVDAILRQTGAKVSEFTLMGFGLESTATTEALQAEEIAVLLGKATIAEANAFAIAGKKRIEPDVAYYTQILLPAMEKAGEDAGEVMKYFFIKNSPHLHAIALGNSNAMLPLDGNATNNVVDPITGTTLIKGKKTTK